MNKLTPSLKFFLNQTMVQSVVAKKFDNRLSLHSIGLNDFMILYHLNESPQEKLRRIDLAEKIGLSASGVTRMLAPLEKIGMVKREANERDARVSFVKLAKGGKRVLEDALKTAEMTASELFPEEHENQLTGSTEILLKLGGTIK